MHSVRARLVPAAGGASQRNRGVGGAWRRGRRGRARHRLVAVVAGWMRDGGGTARRADPGPTGAAAATETWWSVDVDMHNPTRQYRWYLSHQNLTHGKLNSLHLHLTHEHPSHYTPNLSHLNLNHPNLSHWNLNLIP